MTWIRKISAAMLAAAAVSVLALAAAGCGSERPVAATRQAPTAATAFEAFSQASELPVARVPVVAQAPKVDAVADEVYKQATPLQLGFITGGNAKPTASTTVWAVSTADELYMLIRCGTSDPDMLLADVQQHDGQVWQDDCVELFIDPTNERTADYMHIMINSIGTTAESKGPVGGLDPSWNPDFRVKAAVGKKEWTVELAIPFSELTGAKGKVNRVWAVNISRMAYLIDGDEDTAWSPIGTTASHTPERFGVFWLDAGNVDNVK